MLPSERSSSDDDDETLEDELGLHWQPQKDDKVEDDEEDQGAKHGIQHAAPPATQRYPA